MVIENTENFEWDKGNRQKNFLKHLVTIEEAEEVFQDPKKYIINDNLHSRSEQRFIVLGHTATGRILSIAFTIRGNRMRVISARDTSKKERKWYEEKIGASKI